VIKRIVGGAGEGKTAMQQRDGPEEEKKEFPIRKSSNVMPPMKSMAIPVPTSTEVIMERDQNGKNGQVAL
jgi:hypothetical protein